MQVQRKVIVELTTEEAGVLHAILGHVSQGEGYVPDAVHDIVTRLWEDLDGNAEVVKVSAKYPFAGAVDFEGSDD